MSGFDRGACFIAMAQSLTPLRSFKVMAWARLVRLNLDFCAVPEERRSLNFRDSQKVVNVRPSRRSLLELESTLTQGLSTENFFLWIARGTHILGGGCRILHKNKHGDRTLEVFEYVECVDSVLQWWVPVHYK